MNWIKRVLHIGEKIKKVLKKRPTKEEIENSDWTSCCKGPILKKELEENGSVTDTEYNSGVITRHRNGKLIHTFGEELRGDALLDSFQRHT